MKRSRLSGGVLVVAAVVAAMAASAAYGIATATGPVVFKSCISESGTTPCTATSGIGNPLGIALNDDKGRAFVVGNTSDGVQIYQRVRGVGNLRPFDKSPCINETGSGGCGDGAGLVGPTAVTSLGANAYVVSSGTGAIVTITKDNASGRWAYKGCTSQGGADGCTLGHGLAGATSVASSPDKKFLYVGGPGSIAIFKRSPTRGGLTQAATGGCVNDDGSDTCTNVTYLPDTVRDMTISSNGAFLYAAASTPGDGAVLVFARDKTTGHLTPSSCVNDGGTNGCASANALVRPVGVAIDRAGGGGRSLNVAANGSNAVAVFARNVTTGALTQLPGSLGCVSQGGTDGCTSGIGLTAPTGILVYKTGIPLYVAAGDGVAAFGRNKATLAITQYAGTDGCINETGSGGCAQGSGLAGATDLAWAIKTIYVTGVTGNSVSQLKIR